MGFDVSWHPISQKEMYRWYFDRLEEVRQAEAPAAPEESHKKRTGLLKKLFGGNK